MRDQGPTRGTKAVERSVFLLPDFREGGGTGHMFRCLRLYKALKEQGISKVFIRIPLDQAILSLFPGTACIDPSDFSRAAEAEEEPLFVLDMRGLSADFVLDLLRLGPVCGLDPDGPGRDYLPYVIDSLPNFFPDRNIGSPWLLSLPARGRPPLSGTAPRVKRVLISLGGEDSRMLTLGLMRDSSFRAWLGNAQVDVLLGPSNSQTSVISAIAGDWQVLPPTARLSERLADYDLLVTIYGLTAFEAMAAGSMVVLEHPSAYHKGLAKLAQLPDLGRIRKRYPNVHEAQAELSRSMEAFQASRPELEITVAELVASYAQAATRACPACGAQPGRVLMRFPERSYFRCPGCGMLFQILCRPHDKVYAREYFGSEYRKQYGRSYLEDFEQIKERGKARLALVSRIRAKMKREDSLRVLDIGCAYGPFLDAAREEGHQVQGIDISEEAVRYVTQQLGISAQAMDLRQIDPSDDFFAGGFDLVSLWYVIEHLSELEFLFKSLQKLLRPGGILAIGTPSGAGISARRKLRDFLERSPLDHYTVWTAKQARRSLANLGFRVASIQPASFHPERYPALLQRLLPKWILARVHKVFNLGDTMEIYAVKVE